MITLLLHVLLSSYQLSRMTGRHDRHYKKYLTLPAIMDCMSCVSLRKGGEKREVFL